MSDGRVLVTGLGLGNYVPVSYRLVGHERVVETRFVPVALVESLGLAGSTVAVLLTAQARERAFPVLGAELERAGVSVLPVDVPTVRGEADAVEVLLRLQESVPADGEIHVDITHSFRHLPLIALAAVTYLTSFRDVRLGGIYYGAFEVKETPTPIIDLSAVFRLTEWYHAVRSALEAGDFKVFVSLLRTSVGEVWRSSAGMVGIHDGHFGHLSNSLQALERDVAVGLPLEAGLSAGRFLESLDGFYRSTGVGQVSSVLRAAAIALEPFREHLRHWACHERVDRKDGLSLDRDEIRRELVLTRWYIRTNQFLKALIILREAVVNLVLLSMRDADVLSSKDWLDRRAREQAEMTLGSLCLRARTGLDVSTDEQALVDVWQALSSRRNEVAHAGFRSGEVRVTPEKYLQLLGQVESLLNRGCLLRPRASGTLLVAALGRVPGALFTALRHVGPAQLLVVASRETVVRLPEVLDRAGLPHLPATTLVLEDGLRDFHAVPGQVQALTATVGGAGEVVICLTGGSTLLQYAVERLAYRARSLGVRVRAIAAVDDRPPDLQTADPYQVGEVYEVEWPGPADEAVGG